MNESRQELVRYRLARALETLEDARLLSSEQRWNACLNRLYYACFYAVSALLLHQGLSSPKHTGVLALFNKHCVKQGLIPKELGRMYNRLFEHRQKSDYADLVDYGRDDVMPLFAPAEELVRHIAGLLDDW